MQSSGDSCSMLNAVIDSSGAVIYNNGVNRWNFAAAPTLYISGNASTPETNGMHLGYHGELSPPPALSCGNIPDINLTEQVS